VFLLLLVLVQSAQLFNPACCCWYFLSDCLLKRVREVPLVGVAVLVGVSGPADKGINGEHRAEVSCYSFKHFLFYYFNLVSGRNVFKIVSSRGSKLLFYESLKFSSNFNVVIIRR
jgi:hypothetical protein